jgi:hypothetical protein
MTMMLGFPVARAVTLTEHTRAASRTVLRVFIWDSSLVAVAAPSQGADLTGILAPVSRNQASSFRSMKPASSGDCAARFFF